MHIRAETNFLTTKLQTKMKKFYGIILLFTALIAFKTNVQAQTYPCAEITVDVTGGHPQNSTTNYFGVMVTLDKTYNQDITVNGNVAPDASTRPRSFSLTVTAGNLSAQSSTSLFSTSPTEEAILNILSISPSTVTSNGVSYSTHLTPCPPSKPIEDFLASQEFQRLINDPMWSDIGNASLARSFIRYTDADNSRPSINIVFEKQGNISTVIESIFVPLDSNIVPNQERYLMVLKQYIDFNFTSGTGIVKYYDLNYQNHHAGTITFAENAIIGWQTFAIPDGIMAQYSNLRKKAHYCDRNKNGNVTFTECYSCMKNACDSGQQCQTLCDILGFGTYCVGTIGASCAIISIFW